MLTVYCRELHKNDKEKCVFSIWDFFVDDKALWKCQDVSYLFFNLLTGAVTNLTILVNDVIDVHLTNPSFSKLYSSKTKDWSDMMNEF
jgi:hypothetical protein